MAKRKVNKAWKSGWKMTDKSIKYKRREDDEVEPDMEEALDADIEHILDSPLEED